MLVEVSRCYIKNRFVKSFEETIWKGSHGIRWNGHFGYTVQGQVCNWSFPWQEKGSHGHLLLSAQLKEQLSAWECDLEH